MSSPLELVWHAGAIREYSELLKRRKNRAAVRRCVEQQLLAVASNLELARRWEGPADVLIYRFQCEDDGVKLPIQVVLEPLPNGKLGVEACGTILL